MTSQLPNFLVIGPPKCATTWLYFCLRQHPEIFLPFVRELQYFDKYYDKGPEWYERYFNSSGDKKAVGEITPTYISHDQAAQRIAKDLPGVKIIACFRNPIERAYSDFNHQLKRGTISTDFETALSANSRHLQGGLYFSQLESYLKLFSREKILVLIYEDIQKDPAVFLKKIFKFLEVDENFVPENFDKKVLPEELARPLYFKVAGFSHFLRSKMGLSPLIDGIKKSSLLPFLDKTLHLFGYSNNKKAIVVDRPAVSMKPETRAWLADRYRDEIEKLTRFLNRDLSFWV